MCIVYTNERHAVLLPFSSNPAGYKKIKEPKVFALNSSIFVRPVGFAHMFSLNIVAILLIPWTAGPPLWSQALVASSLSCVPPSALKHKFRIVTALLSSFNPDSHSPMVVAKLLALEPRVHFKSNRAHKHKNPMLSHEDLMFIVRPVGFEPT
jgi:hypothetical protein